MVRDMESGPAGLGQPVATPDELVRHLREAGAKRVYLARRDAFRTGAIPVIATYEEATEAADPGTASERARERLVRVFEAIGDQLSFHGREWSLDWHVDLAYDNPPVDLLPLYDRGVEYRYGDGFNVRNLLFAYEAYGNRSDDP